ncbi:hypothetical protein HYX09_03940 [Candidatus Woesearchaeota archaeon]|nr:hypothetical protein [Candidatus Woesearchaeota archaeon]
MAFKRYINRNGKQIGPYYYENVRHDGKVRSIYLGKTPDEIPKRRIRKPLLALIVMLALILIFGGSVFYIKNKSFIEQRARVAQGEPNFAVDQILLKVLVRSKELTSRDIRIMNLDEQPITIKLDVEGFFDIISADTSEFFLKPGQTRTVSLNFSSYVHSQNIEQKPGVYIGKFIVESLKARKEIPIIVEIETKNVLFDTNLNPVALERRVKQGDQTIIEVRLFNLESVDVVNVDMEYFVKDINGNTIVTESETAVVKTQASFFKTVTIPKSLKPGTYIFAAHSRFGNSIGTASYIFEVTDRTQSSGEPLTFIQFCRNDLLCMGLSLVTLLLLFSLIAYFYFYIGAFIYDKIGDIFEVVAKKTPEEKIESETLKLKTEKAKLELEKKFTELDEEKKELSEQKASLLKKVAGSVWNSILAKSGLVKLLENIQRKNLERQMRKKSTEKFSVMEESKKVLEEQKKERELLTKKIGEEKRNFRQHLTEQRQRLEEEEKITKLLAGDSARKQIIQEVRKKPRLSRKEEAKLLRIRKARIENLQKQLKSLDSQISAMDSIVGHYERQDEADSAKLGRARERYRAFENELRKRQDMQNALGAEAEKAEAEYRAKLAAWKESLSKYSRESSARKKEFYARLSETENESFRKLNEDMDRAGKSSDAGMRRLRKGEIKEHIKSEQQEFEAAEKSRGQDLINGKNAIDASYRGKKQDISSKIQELNSQIMRIKLSIGSAPQAGSSSSKRIVQLREQLNKLASSRNAIAEELKSLELSMASYGKVSQIEAEVLAEEKAEIAAKPESSGLWAKLPKFRELADSIRQNAMQKLRRKKPEQPAAAQIAEQQPQEIEEKEDEPKKAEPKGSTDKFLAEVDEDIEAYPDKEVQKCYELIKDSYKTYKKNDVEKAKGIYTDALNIYSKLDYEGKKQVYRKLTDLYNMLLNEKSNEK